MSESRQCLWANPATAHGLQSSLIKPPMPELLSPASSSTSSPSSHSRHPQPHCCSHPLVILSLLCSPHCYWQCSKQVVICQIQAPVKIGYGMLWNCMEWYGMVWGGMEWYGMVWRLHIGSDWAGHHEDMKGHHQLHLLHTQHCMGWPVYIMLPHTSAPERAHVGKHFIRQSSW